VIKVHKLHNNFSNNFYRWLHYKQVIKIKKGKLLAKKYHHQYYKDMVQFYNNFNTKYKNVRL